VGQKDLTSSVLDLVWVLPFSFFLFKSVSIPVSQGGDPLIGERVASLCFSLFGKVLAELFKVVI
jgi:hypothetical protein